MRVFPRSLRVMIQTPMATLTSPLVYIHDHVHMRTRDLPIGTH